MGKIGPVTMTAQDVTSAELNGMIFGKEQEERIAQAGLSTDEMLVANRATCEIMNACMSAAVIVGANSTGDTAAIRMLQVVSEATVACGEAMAKLLAKLEGK